MKEKIKTVIILILGIVCISLVIIATFFSLFDIVKNVIENPEQILLSCLLLIGVALYFFTKKYIEYSRQNKLKELISWCVTEDSNIHRCNLNLEDYIWNAQIKLNLPQQFLIDVDTVDYEDIKIILKKFQQDTAKKYFNDSNSFSLPKSKYKLNSETYFYYLLHSYLDTCDSHSFIGYEILGAQLSRKEYDGDGWDATYQLTDFGIVFYKLLYISYKFCKNNNILDSSCSYFFNEKALQDVIISKTIEISHYRP